MSVQAKTEYARFVFAVKEFGDEDHTPWIMCEPYDGGLKTLGDGFLGFRLREGTDIKQAEEIAKYLNDRIDAISFTKFL
jgi:hypothetical protein